MRVIISKMALVREGKGERAKGRKVTRNKGNELFQTGRGALDRTCHSFCCDIPPY